LVVWNLFFSWAEMSTFFKMKGWIWCIDIEFPECDGEKHRIGKWKDVGDCFERYIGVSEERTKNDQFHYSLRTVR
jgi:hypothetical protein